MALNKGIWDPKLRGTNIKGTNLKSLKISKALIWFCVTQSDRPHAPARSTFWARSCRTPYKNNLGGFVPQAVSKNAIHVAASQGITSGFRE